MGFLWGTSTFGSETFGASAAAPIELAGQSDIVISPDGTLEIARALAGTTAITFSLEAITLEVTDVSQINLAGQADIVFDAEATVGKLIAFAGSSDITTSTDAFLARSYNLAGQAGVTIGASASGLSLTIPLAGGAAAITVTVEGSLAIQLPTLLAGALSIALFVQSDLDVLAPVYVDLSAEPVVLEVTLFGGALRVQLTEWAERMLQHLPVYERDSTHIQQVLTAEGLIFDELMQTARDVIPTVWLPLSAPEWAMAFWEHVLNLPNREGWDLEDRRAAVQAYFEDAITPQQIIDFAAKQARVDAGAVTMSWGTDYVVHVDYGPLTEEEGAELLHWIRLVMPAHLVLDYAPFPGPALFPGPDEFPGG